MEVRVLPLTPLKGTDMAEATRVAPCSCAHPYQDAKYGAGKRVHNKVKKVNGREVEQGYRCTVCGKDKEL